MNILFVSNDPTVFVRGGSTRVRMRSYADIAHEAGGTLHIISPTKKGHIEKDGPLTVYPLHVPKLLLPLFLWLKIRSVIKKESIDIVSSQDPFEYGLITLLARIGTRAILHVQLHTDLYSSWFVRGKGSVLNRIRRVVAGIVLPHAQGIRVVSARIRTSLIHTFGDRIVDPVVIPISVERDTPQVSPLPEHPFTFSLLAVSRLEPEKRIEDILSALALLKDRYPSVGLFIAGKGRERARLEARARTLGLSKRVIFLGERTDALELMQSAQAFIQASAYEGYGRTFIEAASARVPIITTDVGIIGDVFAPDTDVLVASVGDAATLARHIASLVEDNRAREVLITHAWEALMRHYKDPSHGPRAIMTDLLHTKARTVHA